MRIALLTKRRTGFSAVLAACAVRDGHEVAMFDLENLVVNDALGTFDLVVVKSKQLYFLYGGFHAQALGVDVVPDPSICRQVTTRIERPFLARHAGPRDASLLLRVARSDAPTAGGDRFSLGAQAHRRFRERRSRAGRVQGGAAPYDRPALYLEQFVRGRHLLVYFIESDVRAYEKQPFASGREPVTPVAVDDDLAAAVHRWKGVTGLAFGHLDFVRDERTRSLMLVDAGPFPQFRHWEGAAERVSALVLAHLPPRSRRVMQRVTGRP